MVSNGKSLSMTLRQSTLGSASEVDGPMGGEISAGAPEVEGASRSSGGAIKAGQRGGGGAMFMSMRLVTRAVGEGGGSREAAPTGGGWSLVSRAPLLQQCLQQVEKVAEVEARVQCRWHSSLSWRELRAGVPGRETYPCLL